jgi:2-oxoglutarate ferredoxin oxidoreductase subunit alpha
VKNVNDLIIRIAGAAGDGIQSAGTMLAKYFQRNGLYVFTYNYYQDLIRGGQSWYQIRVSNDKVKTHGNNLHILISLTSDGVFRHTNENINEGGAAPLAKDGIAIFDENLKIGTGDPRFRELPLSAIAKRHSSNVLVRNMVALGSLIKAIRFEIEPMQKIIEEQFGAKGKSVTENKEALIDGYNSYLLEPFATSLRVTDRKTYLMGGGEAVGLGAVSAGMKAYFAYPMTPASSALHWLANHAIKDKILVKVVEDEISAINMAIGANYAGIRAMTGSSGGGFALMTEALGMAGMMEIPLVVYEAQRAGPSTGLPTKTEQSDLNQVLGASQGEYPKIIFSPRNVEDCFYCTREAFNLAEHYQLPVIVMSDLYLAERMESVDDFNFEYNIDNGKIADSTFTDYKRYEYTNDGISYRAIPGTKNLMHEEDSDEHNEYGDVISDAVLDPGLRAKSVEKRMRKLEEYIKTMPATPEYMLKDADFIIVQWGSTQGVVEETVDSLRREGYKVGALEINRPYPMNHDIKEKLKGKRFVVVENNYTGQLAGLIRSNFGLEPLKVITKYDGEPFYEKVLREQIKKLILNKEAL